MKGNKPFGDKYIQIHSFILLGKVVVTGGSLPTYHHHHDQQQLWGIVIWKAFGKK